MVKLDEPHDENKNHGLEDIEFVFRFVNVTQTVRGPDDTKVFAIENLTTAWTEVFTRMVEAFEVGVEEMRRRGDENVKRMRARDDFHSGSNNAGRDDKEHGRHYDSQPTLRLNFVRAHHGLCQTTGVLLTTRTLNALASPGKPPFGPFDAHFDRIDDEKGHSFAENNLEVKIRLLNGSCHVTRKDVLLVFLTQCHVPIPAGVSAKALAEYTQLPCTSLDGCPHHAGGYTHLGGLQAPYPCIGTDSFPVFSPCGGMRAASPHDED